MTSAGTHADLIAEARREHLRDYPQHRLGHLTHATNQRVHALADALEEAGRQLADLRLREDRTAREGAKRTHWQRERAEAAEAALKVATDALEAVYESRWFEIKGFPTNEVRDALAAIRQEPQP